MGAIFQHNSEKTWYAVKVHDVLFRDPHRKLFLDPPGTWGRGAGRQFGRPEPTSGRQFGRPQPTKTTSTGDKRGYKIQYGWWGVAKRIECTAKTPVWLKYDGFIKINKIEKYLFPKPCLHLGVLTCVLTN